MFIRGANFLQIITIITLGLSVSCEEQTAVEELYGLNELTEQGVRGVDRTGQWSALSKSFITCFESNLLKKIVSTSGIGKGESWKHSISGNIGLEVIQDDDCKIKNRYNILIQDGKVLISNSHVVAIPNNCEVTIHFPGNVGLSAIHFKGISGIKEEVYEYYYTYADSGFVLYANGFGQVDNICVMHFQKKV